MFIKKILQHSIILCKNRNLPTITSKKLVRHLHNSVRCDNSKENNTTEVAHRYDFDEIKEKNRNTYLEMVKIFVNRDTIYRRGHVEFIYAALKNMVEFGVHRDLQVYKSLIDILPKGKFIPTNIFQAEFMHYPKQQQCIIDLLEQMEENGVMPDSEMEDLLLNIFGSKGFPLRKYWRMMYWMPKFKNLSPWLLPDPLPDDTFDLAKIAIERISSVDVLTEVSIYQSADIKDSIDNTWIVSAQSKIQKRLLNEHDCKEPLFVEGAFKVWLKDKSVDYFILRGASKPIPNTWEDTDDVSKIRVSLFNLSPPEQKHLKVIPSVHEQEDGVIFSVCATGTSSKDSLLSWIRHLENDENPALATVPIVFTIRSATKEITNIENSNLDDRIHDK